MSELKRYSIVDWVKVGVLIAGLVAALVMTAFLVGPTIAEKVFPPTLVPTDVPGSTVVREIPRPEDMGPCVEPIVISPAKAKVYVYSALNAMLSTDIMPGLRERTDFSDMEFLWVWSRDFDLRYAIVVRGVGSYEFEIRCFAEGGRVDFSKVEFISFE